MYCDCSAFIGIRGEVHFLFVVINGVLQGCPLSSVLFNFAIDPLLWIFSTMIVKPKIGTVYACADDIAATLSQLRYLITLHSIFSMYQRHSGLTLSPKKCVLILTSCCASPGSIQIVRAWLAANIPDWADFHITNHAKCLGFFLGPTAGSQQYVEAVAKFKHRIDMIHSSGISAIEAIKQYNTRAVPVLGYIAQLVDPPHSF